MLIEFKFSISQICRKHYWFLTNDEHHRVIARGAIMKVVTDLDLSISHSLRSLKNKQLTGPIPLSLSQLPIRNTLDLVQNQLTGDIPRLIYWDEVLQYLGLRGKSPTVSHLRWPTTENVDALRNKAAAMKSNPIGAAADFDEDEKLNLSCWKEQSRDGSLNRLLLE
ncbi:hypothetical protein MKW98_001416 [Papaver atlanticum]|uniref:Uncharacterized protein n=1 Tax=Papaver atlanticum TaxID=357466 RepID=A0AAD4S381_9MAGN|nr:hypothetical protein MKW98_001416 [Papaver atlanticum]